MDETTEAILEMSIQEVCLDRIRIMTLRRPMTDVAMDLKQETAMEAAAPNTSRSRAKDLFRKAAWIVGVAAIWVAEIYAFDRWHFERETKFAGAAINILALIVMGVGFRRLKKASDSQGVDYPYSRGVNAILLAAALISGVAIGGQLSPRYWIYAPPCGETAQACFRNSVATATTPFDLFRRLGIQRS